MEGKGEINGNGQRVDRDFTRGDEHTMQCIHNMLYNCAPEICILLLTGVTPINSIKRKKIPLWLWKDSA